MKTWYDFHKHIELKEKEQLAVDMLFAKDLLDYKDLELDMYWVDWYDFWPEIGQN